MVQLARLIGSSKHNVAAVGFADLSSIGRIFPVQIGYIDQNRKVGVIGPSAHLGVINRYLFAILPVLVKPNTIVPPPVVNLLQIRDYNVKTH